jgi:hypothetical protein
LVVAGEVEEMARAGAVVVAAAAALLSLDQQT